MTAISRGSVRARVNALNTLAAVDDLDGVQDHSKDIDVTGSERVIVMQVSEAADNGAGQDIIQISKDGGSTWFADPTLLPIAENDLTGTIAASGALNVAGTEPALGAPAVFKSGPHDGPTLMRCARDTDGFGGTDWTTGAPGVFAVVVGGKSGGD